MHQSDADSKRLCRDTGVRGNDHQAAPEHEVCVGPPCRKRLGNNGWRSPRGKDATHDYDGSIKECENAEWRRKDHSKSRPLQQRHTARWSRTRYQEAVKRGVRKARGRDAIGASIAVAFEREIRKAGEPSREVQRDRKLASLRNRA